MEILILNDRFMQLEMFDARISVQVSFEFLFMEINTIDSF